MNQLATMRMFTKVAEALALAQRSAQAEGHAEITPSHIVSALLRVDTAQADTLLQAAGTGAQHVLAQADARLRTLPTSAGSTCASRRRCAGRPARQ